ncbi:MAG: MYXO-CTERM sorting domain-containing protein [Myxococcota bacterium]
MSGIAGPVNGATFSSGDGFTVIADIIDESPVLEAELYVNGELFLLDNLEPWGWPVNGLPDGLHVLEVVAEDENGNQGLSTPVSVLIGGDEGGEGGGSGVETLDGGVDETAGGPGGSGSGSGSGTDTDSAGANDDDGGEGCGCMTDPTPRAWWMAVPLGLLLGRRRRRA